MATTPVLVALMCALVLLAPHVLARPHVLALPIMVAWIAALIRARDTDGPPPWRILPLMILWANLHGSFTFGLVMIGPVALEALIAASAARAGASCGNGRCSVRSRSALPVSIHTGRK